MIRQIWAPLCCSVLLGNVAVAQESPSQLFTLHVKAQPLRFAVRELGEQAGVQVMMRLSGRAADDIEVAAIDGRLTVQEALERMLANTGLTYEFVNASTIRILEATPSKAEGGTSSTESSAERDGIVDVLVMGKKPFTDENVDIVRTVNDVQPYRILNSQAIEQSGATNVEQFLKHNLTMNTVSLSNAQQTPNAFGNMSSINLRGLGANHTLILINGRRTAAINAVGSTGQPDVNGIPTAAIDRIEVLPSSAAAIYGGAAVGGVVNIVLKHEYTGAEIKVTQDNTFDTNAPISTFDATYGTALEDGKTHVLLAAHYSEAEALLNRDRPELLQRGLDTINRNSPTFFSSGSPFSGGTTPNIASVSGNPLVLRPEYGGGSLGSRITYIPTGASGATAATALGAGLLADAGNYNYDLGETADGRRGLNGQALGAPTVKSALMTLRRAWGERLETFAAFSVNSNSSRTTLAPFSGVAIAVPATAPTNPFTEAVTINIVDPTRGVIESEALSKRVTAGFTVRLPYDWQGEADYTWSSSRLRYDGPMRNSARFSADIRSGVLNPFVDTLSNPLDLSSYLGRYGVNFPATLNDVGVRLAGPLGSLPAGAPTLTIGVEHRKEGFSNGRYYTSFANAPAQSSELLFPGQSQTANSIYLESSVPLVSALNEMPAVRKLDMQLAVRTEDFKVSTGTTYVVVGAGTPIAHSETSYRSTNFTVGLRYMPTDDITFRMSYGTAFMPPDYSQLLNPAVVMNNVGGQNATQTVIDPRRGNTPVSVNYISGGNPDLEPEETKNWNVGLIWQPQWLPGLRANVEWYRFDQTNVPVTPTAQRIVDSESTYPDRVVRGTPAANDPYGVGAITLVDYSLIPANKARTDGVDVSLGYRLETDRWGAFDFNAGATRVLHFEQERVFGASLQDFLNQVNNGGPLKLRGNASLGWTLKAWNLGWSTNYYGSYPQYAGPGNTYIQAQGGSSIPSQIYHSVFAGYHFDPEPGARLQMLSGTSIEFGIRNLFDETPPFDAYPGNLNNYYSPFGDPRLRTYWLSLAKTF